MDGEFGKFLSSSLFTFILGADRKQITVHSSPLASLSPALDTLMNGTMLDARLRHVEWPKVDEDTFIRLCEYAYIRNYTPPPCEERPEDAMPQGSDVEDKVNNWHTALQDLTNGADVDYEPPEAPDPIPEPEPEPEPYPESPADYVPSPFDGYELPYREKSIWIHQLRDKFRKLRFDLTAHETASTQNFNPKANTRPNEDFTPVLLGHARLYVVADTYRIQSLCQLVLHKLKETLEIFTLCETNVSDVIEFVRFVYAHTPRLDNKDELRTLATSYIVSVLGQLGDCKLFQDLLAEGGDFLVDFWQIVWR
ncbi:hypothetical protein BO70DRAFT_318911 [Aspergillus heteromorphus CBS 117.55]|uniref:BTB domain-containing protein n=1 Tax=Aspergillus heteromorphus CBS 117.55 TaxID=1448321 RepID=A0A317VMB7_9EURO|nr:uncharacterized protein BO70DRAFT_318911 [Aspergillus heteromorphus CBS 117.55]PWY75513.1 hypothetical protein BO70DRAFT_318911 [Aspergillus heteromorphus CBS 117.55]